MTTRAVPRPFAYAWGKGEITEEVSTAGPHHEPTIQLLEFEDGQQAVRFCTYQGTRFCRMPLIVSPQDLQALTAELKQAPKLRRLLAALVAGA